jgi:ribonuclease HI
MELLGFAPEVVAWTRSYLSERNVVIRVDGHKSGQIRLVGVGIPQGSPLSMILSSIYTAFIFLASSHLGYVDDGLGVAASGTISENAALLAAAYLIIHPKLIAIGLDTARKKFEAAHFTRNRKITSTDLSTPIILSIPDANGVPSRLTVEAVPVIRWLGILFDTKLTFKPHVLAMSNRARSTVAGLRLLGNTVRGLKQASARILYKTVVLPVLTFGAQVWYTGVRQASLIKPMITAQNEGLRWLLGAFRTSPTAELHHIGAIYPIPHLLERLSRKAATRLQTLPRTSQVLRRMPGNFDTAAPDIPFPLQPPRTPPKHPPTIIHHLATYIDPDGERLIPYYEPPWAPRNPWGTRLTIVKPPKGASQKAKDAYLANLRTELRTAGPSTLYVFTDGSRRSTTRGQRSGAGYSAVINGEELRSGKWGLGRRAGVYDAEMLALAGGAAAAADIARERPEVNQIIFLADNQAALDTVGSLSDHPAQSCSVIFRKHIDKMLEENPLLSCQLAWVPGHKGVNGNDRADGLAKAAAELPAVVSSTITWRREQANTVPLSKWQRSWSRRDKQNNQASVALTSPPTGQLKPIHKDFAGSRGSHSRLIQAILGHAHIGAFYARFNIPEPAECSCDDVTFQTREHIIQGCPLYDEHRSTLRAAVPDLSMKKLLATKKGIVALADFIGASGAFSKIPHPAEPPDRPPPDD